MDAPNDAPRRPPDSGVTASPSAGAPSGPAGHAAGLGAYYRWLTRFQVALGWLGHDSGQGTFTVHRRLRDGSGSQSGDVLHTRLHAALDRAGVVLGAESRTLDAGCGLGGTIFSLHARAGGHFDGLTLSHDQAARARREAARRGCAGACRFHVRDFDGPLDDIVPSPVDLVVAIESLAHAPDPAATLARLAGRLGPDGAVAIVDDVPDQALPDDDTDLAGFRRGWHVPAVLRRTAFDAALASAGLVAVVDDDLTPLVPARPRAARAGLFALARLAGPMMAPTRAAVLHDALMGGLYLERLYARGVIRYRLVVARRRAMVQGPPAAGGPAQGAQTADVSTAARQRAPVTP